MNAFRVTPVFQPARWPTEKVAQPVSPGFQLASPARVGSFPNDSPTGKSALRTACFPTGGSIMLHQRFWTAPVLWRFDRDIGRSDSGSGLPHSRTRPRIPRRHRLMTAL